MCVGARTLVLFMTSTASELPHAGFRPGEVLDDRFLVRAQLGKGVFSTVLKCFDLEQANELVAIKIIRHNHIMYVLSFIF